MKYKAQTQVRNFFLFNYDVAPEVVLPHIDSSKFWLDTFTIRGQERAMVSAVPFQDSDFHLSFAPIFKFKFNQINFRTYVTEKATGKRCVFFFGTVLGSHLVHLPRNWGLPWHKGKFKVVDDPTGVFIMGVKSKFADSYFKVFRTSYGVKLFPGFDTVREMKEILTNPKKGFYFLKDEGVGTYSIEHGDMRLTECRTQAAYFQIFEKLGILTKAQMKYPHSVFAAEPIDFTINLPVQKYAKKGRAS